VAFFHKFYIIDGISSFREAIDGMQTKVNVSVKIKNLISDELTIDIKIPLQRSVLVDEEVIQQALNAAGTLASQELLKKFDTDGSAIRQYSSYLERTST